MLPLKVCDLIIIIIAKWKIYLFNIYSPNGLDAAKTRSEKRLNVVKNTIIVNCH